MPKQNKTVVEAPKGAKVIAYTFLGLILLILAALTVKLVLWILGIEL